MDSGNRSEMDLSVGLRFGKMVRWACFQSMYSMESFSAQKARSASSEGRGGIGLFIESSFD